MRKVKSHKDGSMLTDQSLGRIICTLSLSLQQGFHRALPPGLCLLPSLFLFCSPFHISWIFSRAFLEKEELYQRLLGSAQNANMKNGVIGKSIGGVDKLSSVLDGFNPEAVLAKYGDDWQAVLDQIVKELKPRGQIRTTPRSIWPHYCQTILSAAKFVEQFASTSDFFKWVDFF